MNWKRFDVIVAIIGLILLAVVGMAWYVQGPQKPMYIFPPKPLLNWQMPQDKTEQKKSITSSVRKGKIADKTKRYNKKMMNVSLCEDNPNAPDYLSRQMARTREDRDSCAKVKLNMDF